MLKPPSVGDRVVIRVPENIRLHGSLAVVASVEPWGYALVAPAAATGRFRALPSEVESVGPELLAGGAGGQVDDAPAGKVAGHIAGSEGRVEAAIDTPEDLYYVPPAIRTIPPTDGLGEPCVNCGGLNLRRTGACLTCQDCGTNSGCG